MNIVKLLRVRGENDPVPTCMSVATRACSACMRMRVVFLSGRGWFVGYTSGHPIPIILQLGRTS